MNVLLIYPNISYSMMPQMGLLALGSFLIEKKAAVRICDLTFTKSDGFLKKIFADIQDFNPDIIGISSRTMESKVVKALCKEIKKSHPHRLLLAGGPHCTFKPGDLAGAVDYCIRGEGELVLFDIVNAVASSRTHEIAGMENVAYLKNGIVVTNPLRPLLDMSKTPIPVWSLFDERHYTRHYCLSIKSGTTVCGTFEGSRGCPFRCTYCSNDGLKTMYRGLGTWRREKPVDLLKKEVEDFKGRYNMDLIYFIDEVIMTSDARTKQFADQLGPFKTPFIFMDRPELITESRVIDMKAAGAYSCSIGVESANQEYRKEYLLRDMKDDAIYQSYSLMKKHGVLTHCFIMLGMPGQTREILKETYEMVKKLHPDSVQATTFFPLPGTKLETVCITEKLMPSSMPTSYYGQTFLKYDSGLKKWIAVYLALINLGVWKYKRADKYLEKAAGIFPWVLPVIQNAVIVVEYTQRNGLRALLKKVVAKVKYSSMQ